MPERKGRKRRPRERRRVGAGESPPRVAVQTPVSRTATRPRVTGPQQRMPSTTARVSGMLLGIVTAFIAAVLLQGAFQQDNSTATVIIRSIVALLLMLLAAFVAFLSAFPELVRDYFDRRRARSSAAVANDDTDDEEDED